MPPICSSAAATAWRDRLMTADDSYQRQSPKTEGLADGRLDAPAAQRNCTHICTVLTRHLAGLTGDALEIGSGTGQHVVAFAAALPGLAWWPSDPSAEHRNSIEAWRHHSGHANVHPALNIDAAAADWGLGGEGRPGAGGLAALVCINVLHIAPWTVGEGVLRGAGRYLRPDGRLAFYGPFAKDGTHTSESNATFDATLRAKDPSWGVRDMNDVAAAAVRAGLDLIDTVPMPANNFTLVFAPASRP